MDRRYFLKTISILLLSIFAFPFKSVKSVKKRILKSRAFTLDEIEPMIPLPPVHPNCRCVTILMEPDCGG